VIREWIAAQGYDIPQFGRIPQKYLDEYDKHQDLLRAHRAEENQRMRRAAEAQDSLLPE
jgi:antirestriction protein